MKLENRPELVDALRKLRRRGTRSPELLRFLDDHGLSQVQMMSHVREAFGLGFDDVSCIGGWFADGTGELSDQAIGRLLEPVIDAGLHRTGGPPQR